MPDDPPPAARAGLPDTRVTVAVITHNRRAELARTLDQLAGLPEKPAIVVVDNGSDDGSAAYVRWWHPAVRLIAARRNLGAVGRNLALRQVMTPYAAFCDDDTWWEPGSLARAADALDAHPDVAAVTARIVVEPSGADDPIVPELAGSPVGLAARGCRGPRCSASWRARPFSVPRLSARRAASPRGCGWAGRKSCSAPIWSPPATGCATCPRQPFTIRLPWPATRRCAAGWVSGTRSGSPGSGARPGPPGGEPPSWPVPCPVMRRRRRRSARRCAVCPGCCGSAGRCRQRSKPRSSCWKSRAAPHPLGVMSADGPAPGPPVVPARRIPSPPRASAPITLRRWGMTRRVTRRIRGQTAD